MDAKRDTSQTVARALTILRLFTRERLTIHTSEIVDELGLPRTIVQRILRTLVEEQFLEHLDDGGSYRVGPAAFEVGVLFTEGQPVLSRAIPAIHQLALDTGYTSYLGLLHGSDAVIVAEHEGQRPVRFTWGVGERLPATVTALGKAILAHISTQQLDRIIPASVLQTLTSGSIRTRVDLEQQLALIRERGWSHAKDESYPGVSAVGAPLLGPDGIAYAGVSLSFLDYPPASSRFEDLAGHVTAAAERIRNTVAPFWTPRYGTPTDLGNALRNSARTLPLA